MGVTCAPSYANLFLECCEWQIFLTDPVPMMEKVQIWNRYIDDIIMIWQGTESELDEFMQHLNKYNLNIKLTYKFGWTQMDFLDIVFQIDECGYVKSDLFCKTTAVNLLLHAISSHPHKLIKSIPIDQIWRTRRIWSTDQDCKTQAEILESRFRERGYKDKVGSWLATREHKKQMKWPPGRSTLS